VCVCLWVRVGVCGCERERVGVFVSVGGWVGAWACMCASVCDMPVHLWRSLCTFGHNLQQSVCVFYLIWCLMCEEVRQTWMCKDQTVVNVIRGHSLVDVLRGQTMVDVLKGQTKQLDYDGLPFLMVAGSFHWASCCIRLWRSAFFDGGRLFPLSILLHLHVRNCCLHCSRAFARGMWRKTVCVCATDSLLPLCYLIAAEKPPDDMQMLAGTEKYVEYDRMGRVVRGQVRVMIEREHVWFVCMCVFLIQLFIWCVVPGEHVAKVAPDPHH